MSALEVRQAFGPVSNQQILRFMRRILHTRIFLHLFRIAISLVLLPLDIAILFVVVIARYFSSSFVGTSPRTRRQAALKNVGFYPKTILVTGIDTPQGLSVARSWYQEGHRVVGADITESSLSSGESMSRVFLAYYRIPKAQYIPRLLDIVQREKVDIWIPCSRSASVVDDGMAKETIENKTHCKCITLNTELASQWSRPASFIQYLVEKDLPVVESHQVQSRDSVHKILHRSPTKVYHMHRTSAAINGDKVIVLPKRTLSLTYSEVSEIQISRNSPWLMHQHARMGEFLAELLVIHGHITALNISPANTNSDWGYSPLNEGLAMAIHTLMDKFTVRGGPQVTGHLCVRLMVDEELDMNSVRYVVNISGCTQGAAAVPQLLKDSSPPSLVRGYLEILSSENSATVKNSLGTSYPHARSTIHRGLSQRPSLYQTVKGYHEHARKFFPALYPFSQQLRHAIYETSRLLLFWKDWRFSLTDPLPWWWHAHIYYPLRELDLMMQRKQLRV